MRRLLCAWFAACLVGVLSSSVSAVDFGPTAPPKPAPEGSYEGEGRDGGDTAAEAYPIPGLPFTDPGSTCGYVDDYDAICPYPGSTAPDVVYVYVPLSSGYVCVDLCVADYDTKVYVWEDEVGQIVACSDDACGEMGYRSRIVLLRVTAGHAYYFVVDGYGGECGNYDLSLTVCGDCVLPCPDGAQEEGEPPCQDEYVDDYNSGCSTPGGFQPLVADEQGVAVMCGKSCTFLYHGVSYRDTDWFTMNAAGGLVTATCTAEFPLQIILFHNPDCASPEYVWAQADFCLPASLTWECEPGQEVWFWVGPSVFSGIEESDYLFEITGLEPGTPSPACGPTWGAIKEMFGRTNPSLRR